MINMDDSQNNKESEFQSSDSQNYRSNSEEKNMMKLKSLETKYKKLSLKQKQQQESLKIKKYKGPQKQLKQQKTKKERIAEKKKRKDQLILKQKQERDLIQQQLNMYVFENVFDYINRPFTSYLSHTHYMSLTTSKILSEISISNETLQQLNLYHQFYKNMIRSIFLKVYLDFLQKKTYNFEIMKHLWDKMIKQYLSRSISARQLIEDNNQILFLLFQFKPAQVQTVFRELVIRNLIQNSYLKYQKQHETMGDLFKINESSLTILTIRPSFVYLNEGYLTTLNEVVSKVKKSWFVKYLFKVFLQGRHDRLYLPLFLGEDQQKANKTIQVAIQECLKNIKIYFIDYAYFQQSGIIYAGDGKKDLIIFINTYSEAYKTQRWNIEIIKFYVMVNLLHQYLIAILKKIFRNEDKISYQVFNTILLNENSDQQKEFEASFKSAGDLFQNFAFGGKVINFTDKDYQSIKMLFLFQNNPFPEEVEWDVPRQFNQSNNFLLKLQHQLKFRQQLDKKDYQKIQQELGDKGQIEHQEERQKQIIQVSSQLLKLLEYNKSIYFNLKNFQVASAEVQIKKEVINGKQIIQKMYQMYKELALKQDKYEKWNIYFQSYILKIKQQIEQNQKIKNKWKGNNGGLVSSNIQKGQLNIQEIKKMIQIFQNFGSQQREQQIQQKRLKYFTKTRQDPGVRIIKNIGCGTFHAKRAAFYLKKN